MADSAPEIDRLLGTTVANKYRIESLLGRGGMGAVYLATNTVIGKRVALKFLSADAARHTDAVKRFQREAEAAGMVESAHIVQIFDAGTGEDGRPFLVMELLNGEDLRTRLKRDGRLDLPVAIQVATQVLRGLDRAHAAGIVHRDLKPDNVFLSRADDDTLFVKIVDFGISKVATLTNADTLTRQGVVLGTAFYMSPEQAQALSDIDGRTDLWSLGAILYEALSGRPPITGRVYEAVLVAICTKDAEDIRIHAPDVPAPVAAIIAKALARDRDERFASAREMLAALREAAPELIVTTNSAEVGSHGTPAADAPRSDSQTMSGTAVRTDAGSSRRSRRWRAGVALGAVALGAIVTAIGLAARQPVVAGPHQAGAAVDSPPPHPDTRSTSSTTSAPIHGAAPAASTPALASSSPAASSTAIASPPAPAVKHIHHGHGNAGTARSTAHPDTKRGTGVASGLPLRSDGP